MRRALIFFGMLVFLVPVCLRGEDLSTEPVLRIETGMHTERIWGIAADAAGRFLVTGSEDDTIRIWDLSNGNLLRTIRPPTKSGLGGAIDSVAISPDAKIIAAGVMAANSIYLFERSTGRIFNKISGLPVATYKLEFGPDNKTLGATMGEGNGIRIFRIDNVPELEIWRSEGCKQKSDFSFDATGRIITSCSDGALRLYDASFNQIAAVHLDQDLASISFSPHGRDVAVGFASSSGIYILSGVDLTLIHKVKLPSPESFYFPIWSKDGALLYSPGWPAARWPKAGRGAPQKVLPDSKDEFIYELIALPENKLAFIDLGGDWGVIAPDDRRLIFRTANTVSFQRSALLVNATGSLIQFSYDLFGHQSATFSVESRTLTPNPSGSERVNRPITEMPGLTIESQPPTLNGNPLSVDSSQFINELAVAQDTHSFLLATPSALHYYDHTGKELWRIRAPTLITSINLSSDGRLALATLNDGTIRWFRTDDGRELLAFFPHADQKRWVAWTPSGYYDTSIGGEELIGWQVDKGPDEAADWYPASRFRDRFYRPDVVARILKTRDETKALVEADAEIHRSSQARTFDQLQPPVVTLLSPTGDVETQEKSLPFRVTVSIPSGEPVTAVRAYVDGRPVGTSRGLVFEPGHPPTKSGTGETYEISVPIPPRDCTVAIVAETRFATSEPVAVKVRWAAAPPAPEKPTLYLLAVGVGAYKNPDFRLDLPVKDARDLAAAWKRQEGGLYAKTEIRLLTDKDATRDAILSGLEWLETQVTQKDVAVLFFAGHGVNDPRSGGYQFLPYEADLNARRTTLLPDREVISVLAGLPGKALVFLDTCYSGNLLGGLKTRDAGDLTGLINELASTDNGVVVFAASTGRQLSAESPEWKNGVFTKAVVEALNGKADLDGNRSIWITEIESYVSKRLKDLTGGLQTPVYHKPGGVPDFPVAVAPR